MKPIFADFGKAKADIPRPSTDLVRAQAELRARRHSEELSRLREAIIDAAAALNSEPETTDQQIIDSQDFDRLRRRRALRICLSALFPTS